MNDIVYIEEFNFLFFLWKAIFIICIMMGIAGIYGYYYEKYLHWKYSRMTGEDWEKWEPKIWNQYKKHFLEDNDEF